MADIYNADQGVASRAAAAQVLSMVLGNRAPLDECLERVATKARLLDVDRRLVHAICGFVFRNLNAIDDILRRIMQRSRDPDPEMLHQILRVGVAQLLYMEVAPHAAVHATVSACGSLRLSRQKSLVNAVLRSVQRQLAELKVTPENALQSLPEWLRKRWVQNYGECDVQALAKASLQMAPIDITIKEAHAPDEKGLLPSGDTLIEGSVRVRSEHSQITSWPGFEAGAWWVQDLAASLPIRMLGNIAQKSVLDMCAAPGGKTMQLAAAGARVTALDVAASRMTRVSENLQRVGLVDRVSTQVIDARHYSTDERYDVVVLDAPCSSTGTLRRHPELPWIHSEKGISKTIVHQRDLLRRAADLLVHDGILLYCTCSLEPEEGENQVEAFLAEYKNFKEIATVSSVIQPLLARGRGNIGFRTFPHNPAAPGGMDGFFIALLQKQ